MSSQFKIRKQFLKLIAKVLRCPDVTIVSMVGTLQSSHPTSCFMTSLKISNIAEIHEKGIQMPFMPCITILSQKQLDEIFHEHKEKHSFMELCFLVTFKQCKIRKHRSITKRLLFCHSISLLSNLMLCNEQKTRETTLVSLMRDTYTESG